MSKRDVLLWAAFVGLCGVGSVALAPDGQRDQIVAMFAWLAIGGAALVIGSVVLAALLAVVLRAADIITAPFDAALQWLEGGRK